MQGERDGENNYGALRPWSMVLTSAGIVSVSFVVIGVIIAVFQAPSFADALVILFIVGFFGALFATWPIAPAQALKASADIAECLKPRRLVDEPAWRRACS
jgi:hypothetical protein